MFMHLIPENLLNLEKYLVSCEMEEVANENVRREIKRFYEFIARVIAPALDLLMNSQYTNYP